MSRRIKRQTETVPPADINPSSGPPRATLAVPIALPCRRATLRRGNNAQLDHIQRAAPSGPLAVGLFKKLSRSDAVRRPLCWLGAQYIRFVYLTSRWEVVGGEIAAPYWDRHDPFILACWHGRILMMPLCWRRGLPFRMLISSHRDGQLIARTIGHIGINSVMGSSTRGGSGALRAMLRSLKDGVSVGITPDAPRGPYMRASLGIVQVAKLSGASIIPCTVSVSRRRLLGTWDRFAVALPFSRGIFIWGQPIAVGHHADAGTMDLTRLAIESALNAITLDADTRMGHAPLAPVALAG